MNLPRVTIRRLMLAIAAVGASLALLRTASGLSASAMFTASLIGVAAATIASLALRGVGRATWAGFAIMCGGYLALAFGPLAPVSGLIAPPLLTGVILERTLPAAPEGKVWSAANGTFEAKEDVFDVQWTIRNRVDLPPGYVDPNTGFPLVGPPVSSQITSQYYMRMGHILCALFLGCSGAVFGRMIARSASP